MPGFVNPSTIKTVINNITQDSINIDDAANSQVILTKAWERWSNGANYLKNKLSYIRTHLNNMPADQNMGQLSRVQQFINLTPSFLKNLITDGISNINDTWYNTPLSAANSKSDGIDNFIKFWCRFFYICIEFNSLNYTVSSEQSTETVSPVLSLGDLTPSLSTFNTSQYYLRFIKDRVQNSININADNIIEIKYRPPDPDHHCFNKQYNSAYFSLLDFSTQECYFYHIVNSMIKNFFDNANFIVQAKIINYTTTSGNIIPSTTNNNAVPTFLAIL